VLSVNQPTFAVKGDRLRIELPPAVQHVVSKLANAVKRSVPVVRVELQPPLGNLGRYQLYARDNLCLHV
jgi:hypothetical protein